jgi:hypothetical protein
MRRDGIQDWLRQNCPAFAALPADQQARLLDEAVTEERAQVKQERRKTMLVIGAVAIVWIVLLPFTGSFPVGSLLFGLALMGFGVSRYRVASRIELRVRQVAYDRAARLMNEPRERT